LPQQEVILKQCGATIPSFKLARWIMWWVLSIGVLLAAYPLVDILEEWRTGSSARKHLSRMRQHEAMGDRWDCVRGQWQH
jgi:hypothetical protein